MPGIGETITAMQRLRSRAVDPGHVDQMVETQAFGDNPGDLRMLSFVPEILPPRAPLVVVLHGCTQTAEAHAAASGWLSLAERCGFAVLAPEQRITNNPNRCFNWFEPGDTGRDRGEAASIRAMISTMLNTHGLDAGRVFITGLSAGGAMTSAMLAAYPEVFKAGAIIAGLPYGVAANMQDAFVAMRGGKPGNAEPTRALQAARDRGVALPRVSVWHGDADHTVNVANADAIAQQWVISAHARETRVSGRRTRTIWRDAKTNEVLVESNIVSGLGHGTPLSTNGKDGVGSPGPFMLEVEISAATEIARFWQLVGEALPAASAETEAPKVHVAPQRRRIGDMVMASISRRVPADVDAVIAKALRNAGLLN